MNALSKSTFAWLLKREYWESKRGFLWAPFWAAAVLIIITVLGMIAGEVLNARNSDTHVQMGMSLDDLLKSAVAHDVGQVVHALDASMTAVAMLVAIVLSFVVFFYLLGALYDDRRDRSLLFWKSLPVSDTATVISKAVAAMIVAPLIAIVITLAGYLALQVVVSFWLMIHGVNPFPVLWAHIEPFNLWLHLLATIPVNAIWALPTVGWLLFCSAAARSKPFLWAVMIPVIAGVLNLWIGLLGAPHIDNSFYWRHLFGGALLGLIPGGWIAPNLRDMHPVDQGNLVQSVLGFDSMARALAMPEMWIGAVAGVALIAATIWFRRWRDEA